jgi:putative FmdB family regulatory protein
LPLYEYQCQQCKAHFEKIQKFSDPPLRKCENCGGKLDRLVSSPAIQFKGSGWYITDYARKPAQDKAKDSAGKDSKGAETASKPSDGKAESGAKTTDTSKKSTETTTAKK